MSGAFELFLFSTEPAAIESAVAAGLSGVIGDWERVSPRAFAAKRPTQDPSESEAFARGAKADG